MDEWKNLFSKIIEPNAMTPELLEKVTQYRNDPNMAKIKPEYVLLENKTVAAVVEKSADVEIENAEPTNQDGSEELKRPHNESENEPENKKFKIVSFIAYGYF